MRNRFGRLWHNIAWMWWSFKYMALRRCPNCWGGLAREGPMQYTCARCGPIEDGWPD